MTKPTCRQNNDIADRKERIRNALKAWHNGESLTSEQHEIVEEARAMNMAGLLGVSL